MTVARLADPSNHPRTVKTGVGRAGWKFTDEVYNARWIDRVKRKIVIDANGCWLWQGWKNPDWGYALTAYRGQQLPVHRQLYKLVHKVELVRAQYVCHSCDVRHCINPDHMWIGSNSDNQKDASRKGRHAESSKTHCVRGHEFTPENTRYYECRPGQISRSCNLCQRIRQRIKSGWTREEAEGLSPVPAGRRTEQGPLGRVVRMQTRAEQIAFLQSLLPEIPK